MMRWSHGHSLAAGAALALALASREVWVLLAVAFLLGFLLGRFVWLGHWAGEALRGRVLKARRDRNIRQPARGMLRDDQRLPYDESPRSEGWRR